MDEISQSKILQLFTAAFVKSGDVGGSSSALVWLTAKRKLTIEDKNMWLGGFTRFHRS